jgi:hypothetical protein
MGFGDGSADGKAKACAGGFGSTEGIEDAAHQIGGYAGSVIFDDKLHGMRGPFRL